MKFMLDTQVYDLIISTPKMIRLLNKHSKSGEINILCTHIQEDEISKIPDKDKRDAINKIIKQNIVTAGGIWGVSKWGRATYGDGSSSGLSIDRFRSGNIKHSKDALIATTASSNADVLVTEDRRFVNRMKVLSAPCQIWKFKDFRKYVFGL